MILFISEVICSRYAFKELYFNNKFNFANCIIIVIIVLLLIIDIAADNYTVSILSRIRGVGRLFHVPVIFENIKSKLKLQRSLSYKGIAGEEDDTPTAERVVELLLEINAALEDSKFINDINFCIKHIASGKLYENKAKEEEIENHEVRSVRRRRGAILQMEENAWIKSATNIFRLKRDSNDSGTIIMTAGDNRSLESLLDFPRNLSKVIESLDSFEFDILNFKIE